MATLDEVLAEASFGEALRNNVSSACDSFDDLLEASEQDVDTLLLEGIKVLPAKRFKKWLEEQRRKKSKITKAEDQAKPIKETPPVVLKETKSAAVVEETRAAVVDEALEKNAAIEDGPEEEYRIAVRRGMKRLVARFDALAANKAESWDLWHVRAIAWARRVGEWCFGVQKEEEGEEEEGCTPEAAAAAVEAAVKALLRTPWKPEWRVYDVTHYVVTRRRVRERLREDQRPEIRAALERLSAVFDAAEREPVFQEFARADEVRRARRYRTTTNPIATDPKHLSYLLLSQSLTQFIDDRVDALWETKDSTEGKFESLYSLIVWSRPERPTVVAEVAAAELFDLSRRAGDVALYLAVALFKRADAAQRATLAPAIASCLEPCARRVLERKNAKYLDFIVELFESWRRELAAFPNVLDSLRAALSVLRETLPRKRRRQDGSVSSCEDDDDEEDNPRGRRPEDHQDNPRGWRPEDHQRRTQERRAAEPFLDIQPRATGTLYAIMRMHALILQDDDRFSPTITSTTTRFRGEIALGDRVSYVRQTCTSGCNDIAEEVVGIQDARHTVRAPRTSSGRRFQGTVVHFDTNKLIGDIEFQEDTRRIYFHATELCAPLRDLDQPNLNIPVSFSVSMYRKRRCATDVCPVDDDDVDVGGGLAAQ